MCVCLWMSIFFVPMFGIFMFDVSHYSCQLIYVPRSSFQAQMREARRCQERDDRERDDREPDDREPAEWVTS